MCKSMRVERLRAKKEGVNSSPGCDVDSTHTAANHHKQSTTIYQWPIIFSPASPVTPLMKNSPLRP